MHKLGVERPEAERWPNVRAEVSLWCWVQDRAAFNIYINIYVCMHVCMYFYIYNILCLVLTFLVRLTD